MCYFVETKYSTKTKIKVEESTTNKVKIKEIKKRIKVEESDNSIYATTIYTNIKYKIKEKEKKSKI